MALIKYIAHDHTEHAVEVATGNSVMQGAVDNDIEGVLAECGGNCSCATCHVYVADEWVNKVSPPDDMEIEMIELVAAEVRPNSRLSCQITVSDSLDGLTVMLPDTQL